jgi:hypothetical protein
MSSFGVNDDVQMNGGFMSVLTTKSIFKCSSDFSFAECVRCFAHTPKVEQ